MHTDGLRLIGREDRACVLRGRFKIEPAHVDLEHGFLPQAEAVQLQCFLPGLKSVRQRHAGQVASQSHGGDQQRNRDSNCACGKDKFLHAHRILLTVASSKLNRNKSKHTKLVHWLLKPFMLSLARRAKLKHADYLIRHPLTSPSTGLGYAQDERGSNPRFYV